MNQFIRATSLTALLAFGPAILQAQNAGFSLYAFGGGYGALSDLTAATVSTVNFKAGWNAGAGLGLSLNKFLALRGDIALVQSQRQGSGANTDWRKIFTGARQEGCPAKA